MRVSQSDELAEMTMIDRNRALAKKWREISGEEKNNVIKSFEEVICIWFVEIILTMLRLGERKARGQS